MNNDQYQKNILFILLINFFAPLNFIGDFLQPVKNLGYNFFFLKKDLPGNI